MKAVQHIVNVSTGKDSGATLCLAKETGQPFRAVFADTGNEDQRVYDHLAVIERVIGQPVEVVRANFDKQIAAKREYIRLVWPTKGVDLGTVARAMFACYPTGNPYLDLCIWKGRFPSRMAQFCTSELKVLPIQDRIIWPAIRAWRAGTAGPVLQWLGERAEESARRAAKPRYNRDDTGAWLWRPIKHWNIAMVLAIHRRHGLPLNPLYSLGMGRVGCMPCINCKKDELRQISVRFPEHIDRIAEWERLVSDVSKRRQSTFFSAFVDATTQIADVRQVVEWSKTTRGGRQLDLMHEMDDTTSGCHSSYGLCE